MKEENKNVVIMNFSDAYKMEVFAHNPDFNIIDCSDIHGTDCFCSYMAEKIICSRIKTLHPQGIHFIDSGDYHYVSKFWTDKIKQPFTLVLIDHHTDMQPSGIQGLLTCGNWVNAVIAQNTFLRQVIIIGAPGGHSEMLPQPLMQKTKIVSPDDFRRVLRGEIGLDIATPVYVSIDKDVLGAKSAATNWDQGQMSLSELCRFLTIMYSSSDIIGTDVCGEFSTLQSISAERAAACLDSHANETILYTISAC